jgi:HlyD family secretion protein
MTAKVDILTATSEDAVAVPVQAVVERTLDDEGGEASGAAAKEFDEVEVVYLIADGKAVARPVESGVSDDLFVEIKKGVQAGDEVVVGPYRTLKNLSSGDKVFAQEKEDDEPTDSDSAAAVEVRVD